MIEVEIHITSLCSEEENVNLNEAEEEIVKIIKTMKGTSDRKPKITLQNNDKISN